MRLMSWRPRERQTFVYDCRGRDGSAPRGNVHRKAGRRVQQVPRGTGSGRLRAAKGIRSAQHRKILGRKPGRRLGAIALSAQWFGADDAGVAEPPRATGQEFSSRLAGLRRESDGLHRWRRLRFRHDRRGEFEFRARLWNEIVERTKARADGVFEDALRRSFGRARRCKNDEAQMTKLEPLISLSGFVIRHSLDLRHSSFETAYAPCHGSTASRPTKEPGTRA